MNLVKKISNTCIISEARRIHGDVAGLVELGDPSVHLLKPGILSLPNPLCFAHLLMLRSVVFIPFLFQFNSSVLFILFCVFLAMANKLLNRNNTSEDFQAAVDRVHRVAWCEPNGSDIRLLLIICLTSFVLIYPSLSATKFEEVARPIAASGIFTRDGRFLAYQERGPCTDGTSRKVIFLHDYGGSKQDIRSVFQASLYENGICIIGYDRPGYGESEPFPSRTLLSEANDIQDLADGLSLGDKFYVLSVGIGSYSAWASMKYIPDRLAGVSMVEPVINFWWNSIPLSAAHKALSALPKAEKRAVLLAHHAPWFLHWWMTDNLILQNDSSKVEMGTRRQRLKDTMRKDRILQFGNWNFEPEEMHGYFKGESSAKVHIWQKDKDPTSKLAEEYVYGKLPWIKQQTPSRRQRRNIGG